MGDGQGLGLRDRDFENQRGFVQELKLLTGRGGHLPGRLWIGDRDPVGVVVVVHGLGDHSARYESLAHDLTRRDWAVFAFDLPGHGARRGAVAVSIRSMGCSPTSVMHSMT